MKKLIIIMFLLMGICSCEKKETTGKVTFYMQPESGTWNLLIDGVDKGLLDETTQAPICADVDFITLELTIGTHTTDLKSMSGYAWGNPKNFTVAAGCNSFKVTH